MKAHRNIQLALGIAGSALVLAAPTGAANIDVVRDVSARDDAILRASVPMQVVRDVSARDARTMSGEAAIKYFNDNERATMTALGSNAALTSTAQDRAGSAGGFDWKDAGVGAASILLLALLVAGSLVSVRHLRSGPLPH